MPEPTEEDLKRYYDNHHAKFTQPEYRKIGVIAVTPETVKDKVQISEDDLKAAFEKDKDKLGTPEKRHVQQISFPDKTAADAAYQKIQSGTDFVAIAKEQGLSESDIDLGLLKRSEMADATIADAAFKLEKDKVSEPVTGQLGRTVLLRVTEIEPGKVLTFDEAKPDLEKKILKDRAARRDLRPPRSHRGRARLRHPALGGRRQVQAHLSDVRSGRPQGPGARRHRVGRCRRRPNC